MFGISSETSEKVAPNFRFRRLLPQVGHRRSRAASFVSLLFPSLSPTSNQQQPPQDGRKRAGNSAVGSAGGGTARRSWQEAPPMDRASAHPAYRNVSWSPVPYFLVIWVTNILKLEETQQNQSFLSNNLLLTKYKPPNSCRTATIKARSPARNRELCKHGVGAAGQQGFHCCLNTVTTKWSWILLLTRMPPGAAFTTASYA